MMFGLKEQFAYFECRTCGCVQIAAFPENIARHYPTNYYALAMQTEQPKGNRGWLKRQAKALLLRVPPLRRSWLGLSATQQWLTAHPGVAVYLELFASPKARILDVGCGNGNLLRQLRELGYLRAFGVDPFISADVKHDGQLLVRKAHLREVPGVFDCISFHHSLEHIPDQAGILNDATRRLAPGGIILLRIPVVGGLAWRTYGPDWVQLDPPRHYYLHSSTSLRRLAETCGLTVASVSYDSTGFQFWGSELYRRDIPLISPGAQAIFAAEELQEFDRRAIAANAAADGDQIVAILTAT